MTGQARSMTWYRYVTNARRAELTPERATARVSAYVYGNLIALAAVVVVDAHGIRNGHAALVVAGTGVATFVAHIFADIVAHASVDGRGGRSSNSMRDELRDAVPIFSSASVPSLLLALGWLGWLSTQWAQLLAGGVIVVRIASVPVVAERIKGNPTDLRVIIGGLITAALAAVVVGIKVLVGH